MIHIVIPGEPVAQGRARFSVMRGSVRVYDPARSSDYKSYVSNMVTFSGQAQNKLTGSICMLLVAYRTTPKSWSAKKKQQAEEMELMPMSRPDASNYLKGVEDALNGILFDDDSQIVMPITLKAYSSRPRIELFFTQDLKWSKVLSDLISIMSGGE